LSLDFVDHDKAPEWFQSAHWLFKPAHVGGMFEVEILGVLLGCEDSCQGRLPALAWADQGRDGVAEQRFFQFRK
jgi:hypothetical protein